MFEASDESQARGLDTPLYECFGNQVMKSSCIWPLVNGAFSQ